MIPRTIHYCWLSGEEMPKMVRRCMDTWRRILPEYRLVFWDWQRVLDCRGEVVGGLAFDFARVRYWVEKKNYAFAADYIRLWALWTQGGVYLDTDVEVLKRLDDLLDRELLLGEECGTGDVEAAVMGAARGDAAIRRVLESFGDYTDETLPRRMKRVLNGVELLPSACLSPKSWLTGRLEVTEKAYVIHHFAGSWLSAKERTAHWARQHLGVWVVPVVRWVGARLEAPQA